MSVTRVLQRPSALYVKTKNLLFTHQINLKRPYGGYTYIRSEGEHEDENALHKVYVLLKQTLPDLQTRTLWFGVVDRNKAMVFTHIQKLWRHLAEINVD